MSLELDLPKGIEILNMTTSANDLTPILNEYVISHDETRSWMDLYYSPQHDISACCLHWRSPLPLGELSEILFGVADLYSWGEPVVYGGSIFEITINGESEQTSDDMQIVKLDYPDFHTLSAEQSFLDYDERIVAIRAAESPIFMWGAHELLRRSRPDLLDPLGILQDIELGRLSLLGHCRTTARVQF